MKIRFITVSLIVMTSLPAIAQDSTDAPDSATKWSAKEVPSDLVDTIINRNMFVPDQRRAPRVETPPEDVDDTQTEEAAPPVEVHPEDPDRRFRLIGASFVTDRWLAFIENLDDAQIHRVSIDGKIASGTITEIGYNRIEYAVDGETRTVLIGRDLTGAEPVMPAPSYPGASGATAPPSNVTPTNGNDAPTAAPSDADARRAEILRQLRERRERENQ